MQSRIMSVSRFSLLICWVIAAGFRNGASTDHFDDCGKRVVWIFRDGSPATSAVLSALNSGGWRGKASLSQIWTTRWSGKSRWMAP